MTDNHDSAIRVSRLATGQPFFASFDGMGWPMANRSIEDLECKLIHGSPSYGDLLYAAGVLAAYRKLVHFSQARRKKIIQKLREAERLYPCEEREIST